jgi:hypothetical protein
MTLSMAVSKSTMSTDVLAPRAATSAASLHTLAMSAPEKPGVRAASRSLYASMARVSFSLPRWTCQRGGGKSEVLQDITLTAAADGASTAHVHGNTGRLWPAASSGSPSQAQEQSCSAQLVYNMY